MQPYEIEGKIEKVFPTQEIGSNGFKKRTMLLELLGQEELKYKDYAALTVMKDRCSEFDDYAVGEIVKAKFFINSKVWNDRVFTELMLAKDGLERKCAKVEIPPPVSEPSEPTQDEFDDMPF